MNDAPAIDAGLETPARAHLILNPAAGAGRAEKLRERILAGHAARFGAAATAHVTTAPGDAYRSACRAALTGADLVLAVGGDGTFHETVNGVLDASMLTGRPCEVGLLDCGIGRGFAGSVGLPAALDAQWHVASEAPARPIDVAAMTLRGLDGRTVRRVFVSECQVGVGADTVERRGPRGDRAGGRLGFGLAALAAGLSARAQSMTVRVDDGPAWRLPLLGLVVSNGPTTRGGMRLAPDARVDDGWLDLLLIHDMPVRARARFLARVRRGAHVGRDGCTTLRCRKVAVEAPPGVAIAADGERLGRTPCSIEVRPGALCVRRA